MGSVSGWIDLAKWTCFGLYFVLEDLTIVRASSSEGGLDGTDHRTAACNGRLLGAVGGTGDARGESVLVLCLVVLSSWGSVCSLLSVYVSREKWGEEEDREKVRKGCLWRSRLLGSGEADCRGWLRLADSCRAAELDAHWGSCLGGDDGGEHGVDGTGDLETSVIIRAGLSL